MTKTGFHQGSALSDIELLLGKREEVLPYDLYQGGGEELKVGCCLACLSAGMADAMLIAGFQGE